MFARIAQRYDIVNRLLSGGMDVRWRKQLVRAVRRIRPHAVLDLATGSGDVAFALCDELPTSTTILAMDFCQPMLDQAERKKAKYPSRAQVTFQQGDVLALPAAAARFDAVTISFGLRNLADRGRGLREMYRVLRPGGWLFVLEFSQPHPWFRAIYYCYLRKILPRLAGVLTGDQAAYDYLNDTIAGFPDRSTLSAEIAAAGFTNVTARSLTFGIVALHQAQKTA